MFNNEDFEMKDISISFEIKYSKNGSVKEVMEKINGDILARARK